MSEELQLPRAARVFVSFAALLRVNGFAVAPEQTTAFLAAIELLGPRSLEAIRQAGLATLAPPPERRATYDRLFDIHFLVFRAGMIDRFATEEMDVEQPVVGGAPFGRRGERRQPGLPNDFEATRTQQLDRRQECRGLFRRHCKAIGAQQGDKGHKHAGRVR